MSTNVDHRVEVDFGYYLHAQCSTPVSDDREPCPSCWLTICDCEARP